MGEHHGSEGCSLCAQAALAECDTAETGSLCRTHLFNAEVTFRTYEDQCGDIAAHDVE